MYVICILFCGPSRDIPIHSFRRRFYYYEPSPDSMIIWWRPTYIQNGNPNPAQRVLQWSCCCCCCSTDSVEESPSSRRRKWGLRAEEEKDLKANGREYRREVEKPRRQKEGLREFNGNSTESQRQPDGKREFRYVSWSGA